MEGKFIIFVLVASLAQSSSAQPLNVTYGLTEDELVDLNKIVLKQDVALVAKFRGFEPLFDIIQKSATSLIYDHGSNVSPTVVATVLRARLNTRRGWDEYLDAVQIAAGGDCSDVEEARRSIHNDIDSAYNTIPSGILLSVNGRTSTMLRRAVRNDFRSLVARIYSSIRTCLDSNGDDGAVVQQAEDRSRLAIDNLANAFFNALSINAAAVSAGRANISLIHNIEGSRQQALAAITANVESGFSAAKAYYIYSKLSQTEILSGLASNQFALTVATHKFGAMADAIYTTILTHLDGVSLGLEYAGRPDFTSDDAEEAIALVSLISGCNSLYDYIYTVHSNDTSGASAAKEELAAMAIAVIDAVYDGIAVAQTAGTADNRDWLPKIEALKEKTLSYFAPASASFFDGIRNGETWDDESEKKFSTLQDAAFEKLLAAPRHIFNAIIVLAKAVVADRARPSDFSEVVNDKAGSHIAVNLFAQYVSAGGVVRLRANSAN